MDNTKEQFKDVTAHGAVFYTDGSSRPNPGNTGCGIHGYFYNKKEMTKPHSGDGMILTDFGYQKPVGVSPEAFVDPVAYVDIVGSNDGTRSNNYAEIKAIAKAFEIALITGLDYVHVISDSRLALDGIGYCEKWETLGWRKSDGGEISSVEIWKDLYTSYKELLRLGAKVTTKWIKGHEEARGNTEADILSVVGTFRSISGDFRWEYKLTDPKGYWKNEVDRHPFLNIKRIFFNAERQWNSPGLYTQGDSGVGDFMSGKRTPITSYSVVILKEPDPVIEAVRERQYEHSGNENAIMMIKCDELFSKHVFKWVEKFGKNCFSGDKNTLNLEFTDKTPITLEMNPTGLSLRCVEGFNILEELLKNYVKNKEDSNSPFMFNGAEVISVPITDKFFVPEQKSSKNASVTKVELRPEIVVGFTDMKLDVTLPTPSGPKEVTIPYILGLDFLTRNNLKKLESHNPKVTLIAWAESEHSYRYATIAECDTGFGIWSNYHADRIILKP